MPDTTTEPAASLANLPTEIAETIYQTLTPGTLARLARVCKDVYAAVQGPLYRRPVLNSYRKLQQFVQCLNNVAHWDKTGNARSKRVVHLTLLIDPAREESTTGKPLIAVLLARLIKAIARYNPNITITLVITHSSCESQPVRSFESEQFPRVTNLVLDLGQSPESSSSSGSSGIANSPSLSSVIPSRRNISRDLYNYNSRPGQCKPNSKFWTRFFNGISFPDLQKLELHHRNRDSPSYAGYGAWEPNKIFFTELDTVGLAKIERLVVNSVPEFNDTVLMAGLKHAPLLTDLHVEDCNVSYAALDKLLLFALPVLHRLVLRVSQTSMFARDAREQMNMRTRPDDCPHLCAHFRRGGKNLKHFEFTGPYLCRDIFLDEYEKAKLRESGHPGTLSGDEHGNIANGELDLTLITTILKNVRKHRETDSGFQVPKKGSSFEEDRKMMEKERLLRNRRVKIEKERWTRKVQVLEGMCVDGGTFDELAGLAEMEEHGVTWTLGHRPSRTATKVKDGVRRDALSAEQIYKEEFEIHMPRVRRTATIEHDTNDDLSGQ